MTSNDAEKLMEAIKKNNFPLLQELVKRGANVNSQVNDSYYPLMEAASKGDIRACRFLLDKGARINVVNHIGQTPLWFAAANGYIELVRFLIHRGADVNRTGGLGFIPTTPLEGAVLQGNTKIAQILLDNGAKIDWADNQGVTVLMIAVRYKKYECIALLKKRGANITQRDRKGNSALDIARRNKDTQGYENTGSNYICRQRHFSYPFSVICKQRQAFRLISPIPFACLSRFDTYFFIGNKQIPLTN